MSAGARHRIGPPAPSRAATAARGKGPEPRRRAVAAEPASNQAVSASIAQALSSGVPLDPALRAEMEARFGADFSAVRVHDDASAHQLANRQLARAFTLGPHLVFGPGRFDPAVGEGRRLLAHELAHVVQQQHGGASSAAEIHEQQADSAASAVLAGGPVAGMQPAGVGVQREPLTDQEISQLPLADVEARLKANEAESLPMVLSQEATNRLDAERRLLLDRHAELSTCRAPPVDVPEELKLPEHCPVAQPARPQPGVPPVIHDIEQDKEAEGARRARLAGRPADPAQAAALAFRGIANYGVDAVPYADGTGPHKIIRVGNYILGPNALECQDGQYAVMYYIAYHVPSKENQWVVGPESVAAFRARYTADKDMVEYQGSLHSYEVKSVRFVEKAMSGDFSWSLLRGAWGDAVDDPKWLTQAIAAHLPMERFVAPMARWASQRAAPAVLSASMRSASEVLPQVAARETPALVQTATRAVAAEVRPATAAVAAPVKQATTKAAAGTVAAPALAKPAAAVAPALPKAPLAARGVVQAGAQKLGATVSPDQPAAAAVMPAAPKQAKPPKAKTPRKAAPTKKPAAPKRSAAPKAPKAKKAATDQPPTLDEQIAQAKQELQAARKKTSDYFDKRKAAGRSRKGGPKKGIDNAKERLWMLERQKAYPKRQMLRNGKIKGVRGPEGKLTPSKSIAGSGREPDFIELDGDTALMGELKSEWELGKSITGGVGAAKPGLGTVTPGTKVSGQFSVEDKILAHARQTNGKVVVTGYDLQTGKLVEKALDPDQIRRGMFSSTSGFGVGNVWTH